MEVNFFNRRIIESNELCLAFEIVQDLCPRDRYSDSEHGFQHSFKNHTMKYKYQIHFHQGLKRFVYSTRK